MVTGVATNFFSYSRVDAAFVLRLASDLRAGGIDVWIDQLDIHGGDRWDEAVERALQTSNTVLVVLSPESVASGNVLDEVAFALEHHKRLVPIVHRGCEIPLRLRRFQYVDFTTSYDKGLTALRDALETVHPSTRGTDPQPPWHRAALRWRIRPRVASASAAAVIALGGIAYWRSQSEPSVQIYGVSDGMTNSGITVRAGQSLEINATGRVIYYRKPNGEIVSAGPDGDSTERCPHDDCPMRDRPSAELFGRIGENGDAFPVGSHRTVRAAADGTLLLGINDPYPHDNSGSFVATVIVR
jgi:hypothetical protein